MAGHIYFLSNLALGKNWTDAEAQAVDEGGHLVTINDAAENQWLVNTFGTAEGFWIGINDVETEGNFQWVSGEPVTYTNWAFGEPNNSSSRGENYGEINPSFAATKWNDRDVFPDGPNVGRGIIEVVSEVKGSSGDDTFFTRGDDVTIAGGDGDDLIYGDDGNDTLYGKHDNDVLFGGDGDDFLQGGMGNDTVTGDAGNDILIGGYDDDMVTGGLGRDSLTGNSGDDILAGGGNGDQFIYDTDTTFAKYTIGLDTITDFDIAQGDQIVLDKTTFRNISSVAGTGFSVNSEFAEVKSDAAAAISTADIVYNSVTGGLFYNQNGISAGFGKGGQFLTLTNIPPLTQNQFIIQI